MHNHSYENEFNLHVNEISFSYERMTRFEKEAKGNSEMAYLVVNLSTLAFSVHCRFFADPLSCDLVNQSVVKNGHRQNEHQN